MSSQQAARQQAEADAGEAQDAVAALAEEVQALQQQLASASAEQHLMSTDLLQAQQQAAAAETLLNQVEAQLSGGSSSEDVGLATSSSGQLEASGRPSLPVAKGKPLSAAGEQRRGTSRRLHTLLAGRKQQQQQHQQQHYVSGAALPVAMRTADGATASVVHGVVELQQQVAGLEQRLQSANVQLADARQAQQQAAAEAGALRRQLLSDCDAAEQLRHMLAAAQAAEATAAKQVEAIKAAAATAERAAEDRLAAAARRHQALQVGCTAKHAIPASKSRQASMPVHLGCGRLRLSPQARPPHAQAQLEGMQQTHASLQQALSSERTLREASLEDQRSSAQQAQSLASAQVGGVVTGCCSRWRSCRVPALQI